MKQILIVACIVSSLALPLTAQTFAAEAPRPGVNSLLEITPTPPVMSTPVISVSTGQRMGMWWGMRGGMMSGMRGGMMRGGMMGGMMPGQMEMITTSVSNQTNEAMMAGTIPTHAEAVPLPGTITQDLANQTASGQSPVQITVKKSMTGQQPNDAIRAIPGAQFDQALKAGPMPQVQVGPMPKNPAANFNMMNDVHGGRFGTNCGACHKTATGPSGGGTMTNTQAGSEVTP